jgi:hypothetical protein
MFKITAAEKKFILKRRQVKGLSTEEDLRLVGNRWFEELDSSDEYGDFLDILKKGKDFDKDTKRYASAIKALATKLIDILYDFGKNKGEVKGNKLIIKF